MKEFGVAMVGLGLLLIFVGFLFDVSVGSVVNLQKLQLQIMIFQAGLASFVTGTVAYAGGAIVEAIKPDEGHLAADARPVTSIELDLER